MCLFTGMRQMLAFGSRCLQVPFLLDLSLDLQRKILCWRLCALLCGFGWLHLEWWHLLIRGAADNLRKRGILSRSNFWHLFVWQGEGVSWSSFSSLRVFLSSVVSRCSISWSFPRSLVGLIEAWGTIPYFGCRAILWRMIPFGILWLEWEERNDESSRESLQQLMISFPVCF